MKKLKEWFKGFPLIPLALIGVILGLLALISIRVNNILEKSNKDIYMPEIEITIQDGKLNETITYKIKTKDYDRTNQKDQ